MKRTTPLEWLIASLLILLGIAGRFAFVERISVEHFDEGVYANDVWFANGYISRELYAPPLIPKLIQLAVLFFPAAGYGPAVPNLIAGVATIVLSWRIGRAWFGPFPGLVTLGLATVCQLHAAFTRTALTDPLFTLWIVASMYFIEKLLSTVRIRHAVGLGAVTGLAWWTKYNGWFPLAVTASAIVILALFPRTRPGSFQRFVGFLTALIVAAAIWLPVWQGLPNGYGPVAENHRKYVVGPQGWLESALRQIDHLLMYDGPWPLVIAGLVLIGLPVQVVRLLGTDSRTTIPSLIVLVWFASLTLATPLYTPYARLLLPWSASLWFALPAILTAASKVQVTGTPLAQPETQPATEGAFRWASWAVPWTVAGLATLAGWNCVVSGWRPVEDRSGLSRAADQMLNRIRESRMVVSSFRAYGEPALTYHLFARDALTLPLGNLELARSTTPSAQRLVFLFGPHSAMDPQFQKEWAIHGSRFKLIEEFTVHLSRLTRIDTESPAQVRESHRRAITIRAYRLVAATTSAPSET